MALSADRPVAALTITNLDAREAVVQLQLQQWSQQDGQDVLTDTADVLVTPPIVRVPAGSEQIVRVGLRGRSDPSRELSYRLFLREVPPAPQEGFQGLQVTLQVSLPVFVLPTAPLRDDVRWEVARTDTGWFALTAHNAGTRHLQLLGATLRPGQGSVIERPDLTGYVLPGQIKTWIIEAPAPAAGSSVALEARTDAGPVDAMLVLQSR